MSESQLVCPVRPTGCAVFCSCVMTPEYLTTHSRLHETAVLGMLVRMYHSKGCYKLHAESKRNQYRATSMPYHFSTIDGCNSRKKVVLTNPSFDKSQLQHTAYVVQQLNQLQTCDTHTTGLLGRLYNTLSCRCQGYKTNIQSIWTS